MFASASTLTRVGNSPSAMRRYNRDMMRHVLMSGATALFGLTFASLAASQRLPSGAELADTEGPERTRYHVEVIVFANAALDPAEEAFEYEAERRHFELPVALPAPLAPVPEVTWAYPDDEDNESEPVPGIVTFQGRIVGVGRQLPEPRQAPSDRPRLVLEGIRRPPPELRPVPRLALGPDGLVSASPEYAVEAPPEMLVTVARTFAIPPLLELPEPPPVEPPVVPLVGPIAPEPLVAEQPVDDALVEDEPAEPAATEPAPRYADELDREFAYIADGDSIARTFRYRVLRSDELRLANSHARLGRLAGYEPLLHAGWSQEGLGESEVAPLPLSLLGAANPAGTIQLHLQRFLHLTLDLDYRYAPRRRPGSPPPGAIPSVPSSGSGSAAAIAPAAPGRLHEIELAPRYYIDENRRTRSGDLNYFDHPAFGVLVIVTPAPEAPEATGEDAQDGRPAA